MLKDLPQKCNAFEETEDPKYAILIVRGVMGYQNTTVHHANVDRMNEKLGVTPAQREAMIVGSMFGWNIPGANPAMYDETGEVKKDFEENAIGYHCYSCGEHTELKKEDAKVCSCGSVEIFAV